MPYRETYESLYAGRSWESLNDREKERLLHERAINGIYELFRTKPLDEAQTAKNPD